MPCVRPSFHGIVEYTCWLVYMCCVGDIHTREHRLFSTEWTACRAEYRSVCLYFLPYRLSSPTTSSGMLGCSWLEHLPFPSWQCGDIFVTISLCSWQCRQADAGNRMRRDHRSRRDAETTVRRDCLFISLDWSSLWIGLASLAAVRGRCLLCWHFRYDFGPSGDCSPNACRRRQAAVNSSQCSIHHLALINQSVISLTLSTY
jgi:hypothetical protein